MTVTKKTTRKADGTTEVVETINSGGKVEEKRYCLEDRKNGDNENKKFIKREWLNINILEIYKGILFNSSLHWFSFR